jgi:hypothetical protein
MMMMMMREIMTRCFFLCDASVLSSVVKSLSSRTISQSQLYIGSFKTTDNKKREKKSTHQRKLHKIFYIRERERENEKTKTKKRTKDEFDEIRPTNAFMGRKRSEVTLVRENSGLGRRGDERGSGEESHLGWNLATDDVRFAETDGGRERLGE